jgi:hypothetical protein
MRFPEPLMKKLSELSVLLIRGVVPAALILLLACPQDVFSQAAVEDHVVSLQALQEQIAIASATRQQNIATVTGFLSSPAAERAMRDARMDPAQVRTAVPTLSNQELASLATRAQNAQQQFAGGMISNDMLLLVVLIVAVIIIVAAVR